MRYLIIRLETANNKSLYAVVDSKKFFSSEKKALKECNRLNEVEYSINRTFTMAAQDRKEREND